MKIEILHVEGCPSYRTAAERVRGALARAGLADEQITFRQVTDYDEAVRLGFHGSPTILFDGRDAFAEHGARPALACRLYRTAAGADGAPSEDDIARALVSGPT